MFDIETIFPINAEVFLMARDDWGIAVSLGDVQQGSFSARRAGGKLGGRDNEWTDAKWYGLWAAKTNDQPTGCQNKQTAYGPHIFTKTHPGLQAASKTDKHRPTGCQQ